MASLRRLPNSRFWIACFLGADNRRTQRSTKEIDRKRAQKIADHFEDAARTARLGLLAERQARKVIGDIFQISNREELRHDTIETFFKHWLDSVKIESSPKTHQRYCGIVGKFLTWLGGRAQLGLHHLSSGEIARFRDNLAKNHSAASVNLSLACIQAGLSRAFDDHLIDVNECSRVPRLDEDTPNKQERRAFTDAELRAILKVADAEWKGMTLCGAYTGMRLGDTSVLRWENVDLEQHELRFKTEKTGRQQVIPIAPPFFRYLLEIAGNDDPRAPLFPRAFETRQRDIPTGTLSNQFYRLMTKAGVVEKRTNKTTGKGRNAQRSSGGLGYHCLRHSCTSFLKRAGVSDFVAAQIIGHESPVISRIYSHLDPQTLQAAVQKLPDWTENL